MKQLQKILSHPKLSKLWRPSQTIKLLKDPKTNPKIRRELLYLLCYHDFELFIRVFFKEHCPYPFSKMHHDFFMAETNPARRGRREVIAAPRGHAKTTFKVIFKALHAIVYGYEQFIVIIGHSAPEAEAKVKDILSELEDNTLLKEVYGTLAPTKGSLGWSTKNFVTRNGIRVMAKSRGKQVRGLKHGKVRPTFIILDDIESPEKVLTDEQRLKTKRWFEKDVLKLGSVDGNANITVIGTCLHPEALLPHLLVSSGWIGHKYQAVSSFSDNQALWGAWKAIYTDLTNPKRESEALAFFLKNKSTMLAGTSVLWPEAEPYELLMKTIINEGQASFQSEKQNDPYDPERQIFDMNQAKRFKLEYTDGELLGLRFLDGSDRYIPKSQWDRIVAYHDPAMCESKDADYAAIVVCFNDIHGHIYCLDAYIEKVIPSKQIEMALSMHQKWNFDKLYLEENNFQGILKHSYREMQDSNTHLLIGGIKQHNNKEKRIASLEPLISNGQLLFNINLNPRLISQMQLFPTSHDDGPDALHGAVEQLRRRTGRF